MEEKIDIKGSEYISYDLLCNIGNIKSHGNILFLKESFPNMKVVPNGVYNNSDFVFFDAMFLEKDSFENEAIWLKKGSKIEMQLKKLLEENDNILSESHYIKAQDELIERELNSQYTNFYKMFEMASQETKDLFFKSMDLTKETYPWKSILSKITKGDENRFKMETIEGSSEIILKLNLSDEEKMDFYKEIEEESKKRLFGYDQKVKVKNNLKI